MSSTTATSRPGPIIMRGQPMDGNSRQQILIPKLRSQTVVSVRGWATGYGDPAAGGATADLALKVDGATVGKAHDANFTLYNLEVDHTFLLAANTAATIDLTFGNHIATQLGDPPHDLIATITMI